jgi:ElaA protein
MKIHKKQFEELDLHSLYNILKLRNEVFIVEQNCPYQDIDDKDQQSIHIFSEVEGKIISYLRIIPEIVPAIGRLVVRQDFRNKGHARKLMLKAIEEIKPELKKKEIKLQAQFYLLEFYESLGFRQTSETYLEDGIPHVDMLYSVVQS